MASEEQYFQDHEIEVWGNKLKLFFHHQPHLIFNHNTIYCTIILYTSAIGRKTEKFCNRIKANFHLKFIGKNSAQEHLQLI